MHNSTILVLLNICTIIIGVIVVVWVLRKDRPQAPDKHDSSDQLFQQKLVRGINTSMQAQSRMQKTCDMLTEKIEALSQTQAMFGATNREVTKDIQNRVSAMNDIMVNKKARGSWGEYQLEYLLQVYFGESKQIFEMQYALGSGYIVDAALHMPTSDKVLCVDSKFPLENYRKRNDAQAQGDDISAARYEKMFVADVKRHIEAISVKYAEDVQSVGEALMFIPSEALYTEICSGTTDLLDYALSMHVLICSPTTLVGVVSVLLSATKEFERQQHMDEIIVLLNKVSQDAKRLEERADKLSLRMRQLDEAVQDVGISAKKISNNIDKISR